MGRGICCGKRHAIRQLQSRGARVSACAVEHQNHLPESSRLPSKEGSSRNTGTVGSNSEKEVRIIPVVAVDHAFEDFDLVLMPLTRPVWTRIAAAADDAGNVRCQGLREADQRGNATGERPSIPEAPEAECPLRIAETSHPHPRPRTFSTITITSRPSPPPWLSSDAIACINTEPLSPAFPGNP